MFVRLPVRNWTRNRATLLGDAAHAMLQYLARGAAQALEDSAVLARLLTDGPSDLATAFRLYEDERAPRTARVPTLARDWGDHWQLHPGPQKSSRDAMLKARSATDYADSDWFYAYRGPAAMSLR